MNGILDANYIKVCRITPQDGGQYFYGYYDNLAFHPSKELHLCHKVSFMNRLPNSEDTCELGVLNLKTKEYKPCAATKAWNFQQGAMLQWNPADSDEILYNSYKDGEYYGVVKNIYSGTERILDQPLANVSPDGRWGLSINFNRVFDFRPGYGYCNREDPWKNYNAPQGDGVFLIDMQTGKSKQIITYEQLGLLYNEDGGGKKDYKIVINHITFNRESNRFLFLVRSFPDTEGVWKTGLGTCDLDGNIYKLRPYTYASHYYWGSNGTLLIYADCGAGEGLYELQDKTQNFKLYDKEVFHEDIHCSYSPDGKWIIGDGYPDSEEYRPVYLYHIKTKKGGVIGRFYSPDLMNTDIRSDLHCRWNSSGTCVSFDSIHEGFRGIYMMDLTQAMRRIENQGGK